MLAMTEDGIALKKLRRAAKKHRPHLLRIGHREVETLGLDQGFWTDLYHRAMAVSWPAFFACAATVFVALNALFALLLSLGNAPVANVPPGSFIDLFYFSIETLATVGYGDMHPQTHYGHFIATVEIFTGMSFLAVMTGLIFARFSRPRARFVFAEYPVVSLRGGQPTLMIRLANARHNAISRANARLWLIRAERSGHSGQLRRFHELKIERHEHPMFVLSWTLFHVIDEDSPLHDATAEDLTANDALLVLNVGGLDDASAQQLYARRIYSSHDIRWQHRYRDITSTSPHGRFMLDYTKFHDVEPED
jgi:inward rectifier potassium channel